MNITTPEFMYLLGVRKTGFYALKKRSGGAFPVPVGRNDDGHQWDADECRRFALKVIQQREDKVHERIEYTQQAYLALIKGAE